MKEKLLLCCSLLLSVSVFSQNGTDDIKQPSLGLHFLLNDFKTAADIRSSSLSAVLREKRGSKVRDMSPGIALSYLEGIKKKLDFSTTFAASFVDYPFIKNGVTSVTGNESLLLELDASLQAKMFPDRFWVNPYLNAGIGVSKFKGYYGAFLPLGLGIQVDFFNEAYLLINSQYRIPVTTTSSYHFYYSIGFAGNIGTKKKKS
jgi:hypothetical protein